MITNIAFDMGGVIFELTKWRAVERFVEIGVTDAPHLLDDFEQQGIFGALESGAISDEQFRQELSRMAGKELTLQQCQYAWLGYAGPTRQRTFDALVDLRRRGYGLCVLSNTNPFMMSWVRSNGFDGSGHSIEHYFDAIYASFEMGVMKPNERIFKMMLEGQHATAGQTLFVDDGRRNCEAAAALGIHTLQPANGADWTDMVNNYLKSVNQN